MSMTGIMEKVVPGWTPPGWLMKPVQEPSVDEITFPEPEPDPEPIVAVGPTSWTMPTPVGSISAAFHEAQAMPTFTATLHEAGTKPTFDYATFVDEFGKYRDGRFPSEPLDTTALLTRFRTALRDVVKEAGVDHVYRPVVSEGRPAFTYVRDGVGDCLIGRVLIKMGVPAETLARVEGNSAGYVLANLYGQGGDTRDVRMLGTMVQSINDSRQPWGRALGYV